LKNPDISILTPDVSRNCFGRAWLLADLLKKQYRVEIVGPDFGKGIWGPLKNQRSCRVKTVKGYRNGRFELKKMIAYIDGEVIYASKPLAASFGAGLLKKLIAKKKLVLDIDDNELGFGREFYDSLSILKKLNDFRLSVCNWRSYYHNLVLNRLAFLANDITVSGRTLQKQFGGSIITHVRDVKRLDPEKFDKKKLRRKYLPDVHPQSRIVGFIGTPRRHKGVDDLIDAIALLRRENIVLAIGGAGKDRYCSDLRSKLNASGLIDTVLMLPEIPFESLPEIIAFLDIIVIPQRDTPEAIGQVPAKIFDAMAMAKPIVATKVADIPYFLEGCAWLVDPKQPIQLAEKIKYICNHSGEARQMGLRARKKCLANFSYPVARETLGCIFSKFL
jgi:glycosyltransferase involved in cell wall biosynthesis